MLDPATRRRPRPPDWLDGVTGFGATSIEPLEWLALEYVCFNLRPVDREEVFGNLPSDNPLELAASLHHAIAKLGCGWIGRFNGRPAACLGAFENYPGCWQAFAFGTVAFPRVLVAFKPKWDLLVAFARDHGMHRLECKSIATHWEAHRLIHTLGFTSEGVLRQYGRGKQDYIQFARIW